MPPRPRRSLLGTAVGDSVPVFALRGLPYHTTATPGNLPARRDPVRRPRSASGPDGGHLAGKRLARVGGSP